MNKVMTMISNGCFLESCEPVLMNYIYPKKKLTRLFRSCVWSHRFFCPWAAAFLGGGSEGSGFSWKQHLISKSGSHPFLQMLEFFHFSWLQSCSWHPTGPPKAPHWLYDLLPLRHAAPRVLAVGSSVPFSSKLWPSTVEVSCRGSRSLPGKVLKLNPIGGIEWWQIFIIINSVSLACWIFFAASLPP